MIDTYTPPKTYQQWLACFDQLQAHPGDRQMLETLARGEYLGQPAESFLVRLSETVGTVLTSLCRRFLRQLDEALADGEPDMVVLLASRLRKNISRCFFYRDLPFLSRAYIEELDRGFGEQLTFFWTNFLRELRRTARESMNPELEELVMEMKRIKIL